MKYDKLERQALEQMTELKAVLSERNWKQAEKQIEKLEKILDKELSKQALKKTEKLAKRVLEDCYEYADNNNYEREWVINNFMSAFNKLKKDV